MFRIIVMHELPFQWYLPLCMRQHDSLDDVLVSVLVHDIFYPKDRTDIVPRETSQNHDVASAVLHGYLL